MILLLLLLFCILYTIKNVNQSSLYIFFKKLIVVAVVGVRRQTKKKEKLSEIKYELVVLGFFFCEKVFVAAFIVVFVVGLS